MGLFILVDSTNNLSNHKEVDCVHRSPNENPPSLKLRRAEVENTGVEPVTSCMPCKRSSQLS